MKECDVFDTSSVERPTHPSYHQSTGFNREAAESFQKTDKTKQRKRALNPSVTFASRLHIVEPDGEQHSGQPAFSPDPTTTPNKKKKKNLSSSSSNLTPSTLNPTHSHSTLTGPSMFVMPHQTQHHQKAVSRPVLPHVERKH